MKCADTGILRAYLESDASVLSSEGRAMVSGHLGQCARCRGELAELEQTAASVARLLVQPEVEAVLPATALAGIRLRLSVHANRRTSVRHLSSLRSLPHSARWMTAAAVAASLMLAMVFLSPIQLAAQDFLSIFRVQKFAAITIDPGQLPRLPSPGQLGNAQSFSEPQIREISAEEAAQALDFPLKRPQNLPSTLAGSEHIYVTSAADYAFTIDLAEIQSYLENAGNGDVTLPASLDGATIRVSLPASAVLAYGSGAASYFEGNPWSEGTPFLIVGQSRGPSIEVPDSVDLDALRTQVLALPILPADIAQQLAAIKDWRHTLVVPVRSGTQQDVTIGGAPGLLVRHPDQTTTVMWQRDNVVYVVSGNLAEDELVRVASALR